MVLRPQAGRPGRDYEAPEGAAGLNNNPGAPRAKVNRRADSPPVPLFGRTVAGDFVTGASSSAMSFVLRRGGSALCGTAAGSCNVLITIEFVKDGP